jgi:hypothetical protein
MPTITDGTTSFDIEVGQSYAGWTLEKIEHAEPHAQFGGYWFTLKQNDREVRISNRFWPSDRMICLVNLLPCDCPTELRIFGSRHLKVSNGVDTGNKPLAEKSED